MKDNHNDTNGNCLFSVDEVFAINSLKLIVLTVKIIEGNISPKMFILLPLNNHLNMTIQIKGVEFLHYAGEKKYPALIIKYDDDLERDFYLGLNLKGDILTVSQWTKIKSLTKCQTLDIF